ncbi:MAG: O-antigen ligase family protein, partial [bacterium]
MNQLYEKWTNMDMLPKVREWLLLILLFIAPLIFDRRLGIVFSLTKVTFIRFLIIGILVIWLIQLVLSKKWGWVKTLANIPVYFYALCFTIASFFSINLIVSLQGFYGRYEGWTTLIVYVLLFFITINTIRTKDQFKRIVMVVMLAAALMSLYGIMQRHDLDPYQWGGVITEWRVIATIGQPNFAAAYVNMAFYLMLSFLMLPIFNKPQELPTTAVKGNKKHNVKQVKEEDNSTLWLESSAIAAYFMTPVIFVLMVLNIDGTVSSQVPLWYFGWTVITALMAIFVLMYKMIRRTILDILIYISMILSFICILYTQSRGGILGFAAAGVIFVAIIGRHRIKENIVKLLPLCVILLFIALVVIINPSTSPLQRFQLEVTPVATSGSTTTSSPATTNVQMTGATASRFETWKSALGIVSDKPMFGVGPETMKMVFPLYETDKFRFYEAFHVKQDRCHNEVLDMAVTRGQVTLLVYIWLLCAVGYMGYRTLYKSKDDEIKILLVGIIAAWVSYVVQNQFSFGVVAISTLFWVLMGMVASIWVLTEKGEIDEEKLEYRAGTADGVLITSIVIVAGILIYLSIIPFQADIYFKSGKVYLERDIGLAIENFERATKIQPFEGGHWTNLGISLFTKAQNLEGKEKLEMLSGAIDAINKGVKVEPYNADNFLILGRIYLLMHELGQKDAIAQAENVLLQASKVDPYYAEVFYNLGVIYEIKKDYKKAFEGYQRAFMINPGYGEPMQRLIQLSIREKKTGEAIKAFEQALNKYPGNSTILLNIGALYARDGNMTAALKTLDMAYLASPSDIKIIYERAMLFIQLDKFGEAEKLLQEGLILAPDSFDIHTGLGILYYRMGNRGKALDEFRQAQLIDPGNSYAKRMIEL